MMMQESIDYYQGLGWALCSTRASDTKRPYPKKWNMEGRPSDHWARNPTDGVGLIHELSGTCSIDIDCLESATLALASVGIDLTALLNDPNHVGISSEREGRAKLLFRVPEGFELPRHALNWPNKSDPKKKECIIELRFRGVMDVLPPTIHPDTQRPYEWIGDPARMPELPASLLDLWQEWATKRHAMQDACPWAPVHEVPESAQMRVHATGGRGSVIDAFNDQVSIASLLDRHGYRKAGLRWFAPASKSGEPGVVRFTDGPKELVYSHHGSDPLGDGHAHDAFSVFCVLDHRGDATAAVKEAAGLLGIEQEPDHEAAAMAAKILESARKAKAKPATPTGLVVPLRQPETQIAIEEPSPGPIPVPALRDAWTWVAGELHSLKPDAVTQSVLSLGCAITSRRYVTRDGQPTAAFFGITDSSVAGLRPIKPACYRLAVAAGDRAMLRGTKIASSGVLYSALLRSPRMYWYTDEYGHTVQMARRQQSGALESAVAVLHEAYTGQTIFIDPDTSATSAKLRALDECDIYSPAVTICALLSNDHISALAMRSEYGRGTLQQMLIIPAGESTQGHAPETGDHPEPYSFLKYAELLTPAPGLGGLATAATMRPKLIAVEWERDVGAVVSGFRSRMQDYMSDPSRANWRGMVHGYTQSAIRIATMLAAWDEPSFPRVSTEHMTWACTWAERCLRLTMPRLEIASTDTDEPDVMQRVQELLLIAGEPMTLRDISRRCRPFVRLSRDAREDLMQTLIDDGAVIAEDAGQTRKYLAKVAAKA